ncbi:MAG: hypothetical protein AMXMBFR84_46280 [Candidatus Hydrogenedentota bacterium]
MPLVSSICLLLTVVHGASGVSGHIADSANQPIAGARVFIQQGIAGDLLEQTSAMDGTFRFSNLQPGVTGVFAYADGYAFGGKTVKLALDEDISGVSILLHAPVTVEGVVSNFKSDPLSDAYVTGILILGADQVGIPLDKLQSFGFELPKSGPEGKLIVRNVPQGGRVGLKVRHKAQAQAAVMDIQAGTRDVRISMNPGVAVEGKVLARESGLAVADATIIVRNTRPPNDTVTVLTNNRGSFNLRLEPGIYQAQVSGVELRSPGWEKVTVTGEEPNQAITLRVAGTSTIRGTVNDAITGKPIAGAKLRLSAFSTPAASMTTGDSGTYEFLAVEGENLVTIEPPAGYAKPEMNAMRVQVTQGKPQELLAFWLKPVAPMQVQILDEQQNPLAGAMVRLVNPSQYRWYQSDQQGMVTFEVAQFPADGGVVGLVEVIDRPLGALFQILPGATELARVQVLPLSTVIGTVMSDRDNPVNSALVACVFEAVTGQDPLVLWQSACREDGSFTLEGIVPYVPLICVASLDDAVKGQSIPFNLKSGELKEVGRVVLPQAQAKASLLGRTLPFQSALPVGEPALVMYCQATEAPMLCDALSHLKMTLGAGLPNVGVVVDGSVTIAQPGVATMQGISPGPGKTYLLGADGRVLWEGSGMPPFFIIQRLTGLGVR